MPDDALANAMPYMQAFGHVVLAWVWLDLALAAQRRCASRRVPTPWRASCRRCATSMRYELPKVAAWLGVVNARDPVCRDMRDEWF